MCHEDWSADQPPTAAVERISVAVAGGQLPMDLHRPADGRDVRGACVLATDIYGTVPFYREISSRLASAGFATGLVDLFFREGPLEHGTREEAFARRSRMDERRALADLDAALDVVKDRTTGERVGIVGFCLGGLFALDLAAERADLAAVSYYGFPEGCPGDVRVPAPRPIDLVDRIKAPVLAFWGDQDHIVSTESVARFEQLVRREGLDYESCHYPEAGHGFLQGLVEERDDSEVARQSWSRTLEFLGERLAVSVSP